MDYLFIFGHFQGTVNCFLKCEVISHTYSLFSKEKNSRKRKLNEIQTQLEESNKKLKQTEESIQKLSTSKQDENEKKKVIESITDLQIEKDELCNKLKKYKDNDPKALETKKASIQVCILFKVFPNLK